MQLVSLDPASAPLARTSTAPIAEGAVAHMRHRRSTRVRAELPDEMDAAQAIQAPG
jgi:hypothetical protein